MAQNQTTIKKHTHKLKKHRFKSGNETFFCVDDCNYKVTPALALGKTIICWRCGESFKMNDYSLRLVKPHCEMCHKSKNGKSNDTPIFTPTLDIAPSFADIPEHLVKELIEETYDAEAPLSLSERLKKTTQIDHSKHEDESDEEL